MGTKNEKIGSSPECSQHGEAETNYPIRSHRMGGPVRAGVCSRYPGWIALARSEL